MEEETLPPKQAGPSERRRVQGEELLENGQRREEARQAASAAERYRVARAGIVVSRCIFWQVVRRRQKRPTAGSWKRQIRAGRRAVEADAEASPTAEPMNIAEPKSC